MTSLRRKISVPYICTIIIIPLFIMLLFNMAMHYFSSKQAVASLQNVLQTVERGLDFFEENNIDIGKVSALIRARNLTTSAELFLYTAEGESVNPYLYAINFLNSPEIKEAMISSTNNNVISFSRKLFNEEIASNALHAGKEKVDGEMYVFSKQSREYHAVKFTIPIQNTFVTAVYISRGDFSYEFIDFINTILLIISVLTICIAIFISKYVVLSVSKPIEYITSIVGEAEKDKFIVVKNTSNILELQILSEKINEMSKSGYDYMQAQKSFFQNASHELRTPLANIQGYAEGMEHGVFTDVPKYSHIIGTEVQRLSNLVNDILSLSRIENEALHASYVAMPAWQAVENILQRAQDAYEKAGIEIIFHCTTDGEIYIHEEHFEQGLMNIVNNALRYAQKYVSLTASEQGEQVKITISDDGEGVCEQDKPYIFQKFYKGKGGQFGLGLAIAKSAMKRMHGNLFLEESEKGATFVILLPKYLHGQKVGS